MEVDRLSECVDCGFYLVNEHLALKFSNNFLRQSQPGEYICLFRPIQFHFFYGMEFICIIDLFKLLIDFELISSISVGLLIHKWVKMEWL